MSLRSIEVQSDVSQSAEARASRFPKPLEFSPKMRDLALRAAAAQPPLAAISHRRDVYSILDNFSK